MKNPTFPDWSEALVKPDAQLIPNQSEQHFKRIFKNKLTTTCLGMHEKSTWPPVTVTCVAPAGAVQGSRHVQDGVPHIPKQPLTTAAMLEPLNKRINPTRNHMLRLFNEISTQTGKAKLPDYSQILSTTVMNPAKTEHSRSIPWNLSCFKPQVVTQLCHNALTIHANWMNQSHTNWWSKQCAN